MCTFQSEFIHRFPNTQRLSLQFSVVEYINMIISIFFFFFFLLQNKQFKCIVLTNCLLTDCSLQEDW